MNAEHWPRVSTILKVLNDAYGEVPEAVLATAAERGERLHRLCLSYLASLDGLCEAPSQIPADEAAAYVSFVQWVKANQVTPLAVEQESSCSAHRYRGTPDALVEFGPKRLLALIDLKFTASILRVNRVQVQAYQQLDLYKDAKHMLLIHIAPKDGHLTQETIRRDARDFAAFLNALSVWRWRQS